MRTGVQVDSQEVLSVCLSEDGLHLKYSAPKIRKAIQTLDWGKSSEPRMFLDTTKTAGTTVNKLTSSRKRAANIFLSKLPEDLCDSIKKGLFLTHMHKSHAKYQIRTLSSKEVLLL